MSTPSPTVDSDRDRETLIALIPVPLAFEHVADWPEDEREFYRHGEWTSFTDRRAQLDQMRRGKVADAILAAGFTRHLGV